MKSTFAVLLADQSRWKDLGSGFRGEHAQLSATDIITTLLLVVGAAVVIWFLTQAMARQDRKRSHNSPRKLFKSLCQAHGLSRMQSRLLARMARIYDLARPAQLFLEPDRFSAARLPAVLKSERAEVEKLGKKLFGQL